MADRPKQQPDEVIDAFTGLLKSQSDATRQMMEALLPGTEIPVPDTDDAAQWAEAGKKLQKLLIDFQSEQARKVGAAPTPYADPAKWFATYSSWYGQMPLSDPDTQKKLWEDGLALFETVLGQYGIGPRAEEKGGEAPELPRKDRRFSDPRWSENPFFAIVHQAYLMLSENIEQIAENLDGIEPARKRQMVFATRMLLDALSPSNFPLTNPVALERVRETKGESLVKGLENLLSDLTRGQLTHSDPRAFELGKDLAATPGKVVYETPLFQLIQYAPTTEKVLEAPLVIFPPWINRFYILDLVPRKSFVKWAVDQGLTVFMVSWKSADASMADLEWDDYIAAQIEAIDKVCERLKVPSAHTIGYCVAGTTLAATLAVLARKGEADKVRSATFFTAQVDFEHAGDLKNFVDDASIEVIGQLAQDGYVDGRYLAATFNLLRGNELLWNYVSKNYLMGEEPTAFDLLHWNGDVTNLPAKWHRRYLRDLYRDNRLVVPDSLKACGVPLDLRRIETPCYIQAGREDHIAPVESVWKLTRYLSGPWTFLLAGSGHIAGVVNPPAAGKYQYWVNDANPDSLDDFIAGATEYPGSWWPHWEAWLRDHDPAEVNARGKRKPGGRGDKVVEDAPGRYVKTR